MGKWVCIWREEEAGRKAKAQEYDLIYWTLCFLNIQDLKCVR